MESISYKMRMPCKYCQHEFGKIEEKNGQNVVHCLECGRHAYNAPKSETGEPQRNIKTREDISPGLKAKILERDGGRCCACGRSAISGAILHIGHMISVAECRDYQLKESWINDERNLMTLCEECNLGMGARSVTAKLSVAVTFWREYGRNKHANT